MSIVLVFKARFGWFVRSSSISSFSLEHSLHFRLSARLHAQLTFCKQFVVFSVGYQQGVEAVGLNELLTAECLHLLKSPTEMMDV